MQQVGLADAGRAVEEERVVGLAGQLGDGERGGVGEAVRVADDELLEGVLRVEAGLGGRREVVLGVLAGSRRACAIARLRRRGRGPSSPARTPDDRAGPEHRDRAGLQDACEALGDPGAQLARSLDDDLVAGDLDEPQRGEPDLVHVRRDPLPELALDASPGVVGVVGHSRRGRSPVGETSGENDGTGAAEAAGAATISGVPSRVRRARGSRSQIAGNSICGAMHRAVQAVCMGVCARRGALDLPAVIDSLRMP